MQFIVDTYTLEYLENENKYYISFEDSVKKKCRLEIGKDVFDEYIQSRKCYTKIKNETTRYLEHSELNDISLFNRSFIKKKLVDDVIIEKLTNQALHKAVDKIKSPHNKRIKMYFFEEMTVQEIAKKEAKTERAIRYSIEQGIKEIQKNLKDF